MRNYDRSQTSRAIATSADGGLTWSGVRHDPALVEPICQASLIGCTMPDGSLRLLFSNPAHTGKRLDMTVRMSNDEGKTWPVRRLITDDGPSRRVDGGGNTGTFTLSPTTAEPRGYLAATQTPDGLIHLITSKQHYMFNASWIKSPMPAEKEK